MNKLQPIQKLTESQIIELGLKSGLEIHQQLQGKKLFCSCPTTIRDDEPDFIIKRKLRASTGELGKTDLAAEAESKKEKEFIYQAYNNTTCLVELDEAPPQNVNQEALNTALAIAKIFNMTFPDKVKVMRKIVIDGSNTSGFQRTTLIATDGLLEQNSKITIESVCLEEDSAKIVKETSENKKYNLSRLGIPLIEIATGPDLKTPLQVKETAEFIGTILRSFPNVKRGLGTIRQDVNVSIKEGVRVEIKGAQDLKLIPTIVEYEALRQKNMLNLFQELKKRKAKVNTNVIDLSKELKDSSSKVIQQGLSKKEGCVLGIQLQNFSGLIGFEVQPGRRFGSELSDHAKTTGVKGLFHSDELPNYGITQEEKNLIAKKLSCKENDAFIILADSKIIAQKAIEKVIARAQEFSLFKCVRMARPDGTSSYMRPMPGASRMYPETDLKSIQIDPSKIVLPKLLSERIKELQTKFDLTEDIAKKLIKEELDLMTLADNYPNIKPAYMLDYYFSFPSMIKKKYNEEIDVKKYAHELFSKLNKNKITKDSIPELLLKLTKNKEINYNDYKLISIKDIEKEITEIISQNKNLPKGALIGKIIAKYAGKIDGKEISEFVSKKLN